MVKIKPPHDAQGSALPTAPLDGRDTVKRGEFGGLYLEEIGNDSDMVSGCLGW